MVESNDKATTKMKVELETLWASVVNLSTLRSTLLRMPCTHSNNEADQQRRGDLNGDDQITVSDAIIALQMTVRGVYDDAADMNSDGRGYVTGCADDPAGCGRCMHYPIS